MVTSERLKELLEYSPTTGVFIRRSGPKAGHVAGYPHGDGYRAIWVEGRGYYEHRPAWLYVYGVWPGRHLDHIDGDKANNRIENLREATREENLRNRGKNKNNTSGFKGVFLHKQSGKYIARCQVKGRYYYMGRHDTPEAAHKAYEEFARRVHGEFFCEC